MSLLTLKPAGLLLLSLFATGGCSDDSGHETTGSGGASGTRGCEADDRGDVYHDGIEKTNAEETLTVAIQSAVPAPPAPSVDNVWEILVTNGDGDPVAGATIAVRPWMVDHAHPSGKDVVVDDKGKGHYALEPLHFPMAGYWETTLFVTPPGGEKSSVVFGFCMDG